MSFKITDKHNRNFNAFLWWKSQYFTCTFLFIFKISNNFLWWGKVMTSPTKEVSTQVTPHVWGLEPRPLEFRLIYIFLSAVWSKLVPDMRNQVEPRTMFQFLFYLAQLFYVVCRLRPEFVSTDTWCVCLLMDLKVGCVFRVTGRPYSHRRFCALWWIYVILVTFWDWINISDKILSTYTETWPSSGVK